jgi:ATP-binding cassette subfamily B protein
VAGLRGDRLAAPAPYKGALSVVVVLLALQTMANLYLPYLNADIINNGVVTGDTAYILRVGGLMLLISLLTVVAAVFSTYYPPARPCRWATCGGRCSAGSSASLAEMGSFGAPSLITRNTNDVQQVQMLVLLGLTMMIMAPLTMIGGVIMAMRTDLTLSTLMFIVVPLMMAFIAVIVRTAVPLFAPCR